MVRSAASTRPVEWLDHSLFPWGKEHNTRVCSVVPLGYEAYARILHPAYGPPPERAQLWWRDIGQSLHHAVHAETQWESLEELAEKADGPLPWHEPPMLGQCPNEVITPLAEQLSRNTTTPSEIYFAMWVGFTDVRSLIQRAPHFTLPDREYALLVGSIDALPMVIESPSSMKSTPSLSWPADRSWCMATEVDFRWTYVAATAKCISDLTSDQRLEVIVTVPEHRGDIESDRPRDGTAS